MVNWLKKKDPRLQAFYAQLDKFKSLDIGQRVMHQHLEIRPYLDDATSETPFDAHYVYHPAWAVRIVKQISPALHVDISSTLHFCTMLSAFVKTIFYDYRPAKLTLSDLTCHEADLTNLFFESESVQSLSCMHTLEHIGLGRYGDPIDPNGDLKAINELSRVCAVNGDLLVVVPVGKKQLVFNAHRIYDAEEFLSFFPDFELLDFSLVTDEGNFIEKATFNLAASQSYGCGCYWLKKVRA